MGRAINADIIRQVDDHGGVWFNGTDAAELLLRGYDVAELLIHPTPEITVYNDWCDRFDKTAHQIRPNGPRQFSKTWWISERFRNLPVRETVLQRCETGQERNRVNEEMDLFEARDMIPVLRLMFMLVDHFRRNNIVWGVGRGSSVASYVLFLIGIHRINSLQYNLDIAEFLRT
jgi:hypothetical protein